MNTKSRITSILNAVSLDTISEGLQNFHLSDLRISDIPDIQLPNNLRLGHLVERVVSELIKSSVYYSILFENIQIEKNNTTIGEIDFIIQETDTNRLIHLELAYKFYLYDPSISPVHFKNWIGPNRNDSLFKKINKTRNKQFPLLYDAATQSVLSDIQVDSISQALCLLTSLYIPYKYSASFTPIYEQAIKGYYIDLNRFMRLDHASKTFYLPTKTEWGINPADHETWEDIKSVEKRIKAAIAIERSVLCWQKSGVKHTSFFVVWW